MRTINCLLLVLMMSLSVLAQPLKASLICSPKKDNVKIWMSNERSINEGPLFIVNSDDRLCVTEEAKDWYKIWINNKVGWVLKSEVVVLQRSKKFEFENAEIMGYLDNPTPVYIIDADAKEGTPINLDRSFQESLRENTDKETMERQAEGQ